MSHLVISERIGGHLVQTVAGDHTWGVMIGTLPRLTIQFVSTPPSRYELELLAEIHDGLWAAREGRN